MKKVKVIQTEKEVPFEIIAQSIVDINKSMKTLEQSRLTRKAVVSLIHDNSKLPKRTIEIVLNNLESLEVTWLKKKV